MKVLWNAKSVRHGECSIYRDFHLSGVYCISLRNSSKSSSDFVTEIAVTVAFLHKYYC